MLSTSEKNYHQLKGKKKTQQVGGVTISLSRAIFYFINLKSTLLLYKYIYPILAHFEQQAI